MKKLIFLFAMVFAVSMVMAQTNSSVITEEGTNQEATVDQQGGANTSSVFQSNMNNVANVTQINYLLMDDDAEDATNSNVIQTGKSNTADVSQTHNREGQYAGPGGILNAYINQSGNNNVAEQIQGGHSQMGTSIAEITQIGNGNYAFQNQVKYGNEARIVQEGAGNRALQAQDISLPADAPGSMNIAFVTQPGDNNLVEQEQNGWANNATATQLGNGNTSLQIQNGWVSDVSVYQVGNSNEATQNQTGALNSAVIEQWTNGNFASQIQTSDANRNWLDEDGKSVFGGYDDLNRAEIFQLGGNSNSATQEQTTPGGPIDANYARIWQDGVGNTAGQIQTGGFNYSTVSQTGNGHMANVTQSQSIDQAP